PKREPTYQIAVEVGSIPWNGPDQRRVNVAPRVAHKQLWRWIQPKEKELDRKNQRAEQPPDVRNWRCSAGANGLRRCRLNLYCCMLTAFHRASRLAQ